MSTGLFSIKPHSSIPSLISVRMAQFQFNNIIFAGIRRLQLILLKVALLFGAEIRVPVKFVKILEPNSEKGIFFQQPL